MYIATIPNRTSPPAILLREGYREGGKAKNRTLANLSKLPPEAIDVLRRVLKGHKLVSTDDLFEIVEDGSPSHGHVEAVMIAMQRLGFAGLVSSKKSRQRDLVVAMVAARILNPQSKLATTRWWGSTTLPDMLGIGNAGEETMDTDRTVRNYKQLSKVEGAFRCLKSVDLMVRPIRHRLEDRVRAHIFLSVLAYYVQWHMIEAWRPMLFADEDQEVKISRDPVAPAKRSKGALKKVSSKLLDDGSPAHSFRTLLSHLGDIVRNTCRCPNAGSNATFFKTTSPNAKQLQAFDLLRKITL